MAEKMLSVADIAAELSVSRRTVQCWITGGAGGIRLKAIKAGGQYRVKREWLDDFLNGCGSRDWQEETFTERDKRIAAELAELERLGWT